MANWNGVNRQYETAYPGHNRVVEYLILRQREAEAKIADTDPNPDLLAKRRANLGKSTYQIQQNLGATHPGQAAGAARVGGGASQ